MNPKRWPNLLSGARIALMPAVLLAAIAGSQLWFLVLVGASLATDALDGFLARRLNAFSDFGRKLDSAADYLTMITGLAGIAILWPEIVRRELPWIATGLTAFFGLIVFGFVRLGHPLCYHTWAAKAGVAGCALSMIPLLTGWSASQEAWSTSMMLCGPCWVWNFRLSPATITTVSGRKKKSWARNRWVVCAVAEVSMTRPRREARTRTVRR